MTAGLRERKKAETREALYRAALQLAIEHGPDRITVEAIADRVGVSRRTFSNYFANKEEALLYGDQQRMRLLIHGVRSRPADEPAWTALTRAAEQFCRRLGDLDPALVARVRLVRNHPALAAQQVSTFAALERELEAAVAARIGDAGPFGVRARLAAATFLAAMRVSLHLWLDEPDRSLLEIIQAALAEAGRGFAGD